MLIIFFGIAEQASKDKSHIFFQSNQSFIWSTICSIIYQKDTFVALIKQDWSRTGLKNVCEMNMVPHFRKAKWIQTKFLLVEFLVNKQWLLHGLV